MAGPRSRTPAPVRTRRSRGRTRRPSVPPRLHPGRRRAGRGDRRSPRVVCTTVRRQARDPPRGTSQPAPRRRRADHSGRKTPARHDIGRLGGRPGDRRANCSGRKTPARHNIARSLGARPGDRRANRRPPLARQPNSDRGNPPPGRMRGGLRRRHSRLGMASRRSRHPARTDPARSVRPSAASLRRHRRIDRRSRHRPSVTAPFVRTDTSGPAGCARSAACHRPGREGPDGQPARPVRGRDSARHRRHAVAADLSRRPATKDPPACRMAGLAPATQPRVMAGLGPATHDLPAPGPKGPRGSGHCWTSPWQRRPACRRTCSDPARRCGRPPACHHHRHSRAQWRHRRSRLPGQCPCVQAASSPDPGRRRRFVRPRRDRGTRRSGPPAEDRSAPPSPGTPTPASEPHAGAMSCC